MSGHKRPGTLPNSSPEVGNITNTSLGNWETCDRTRNDLTKLGLPAPAYLMTGMIAKTSGNLQDLNIALDPRGTTEQYAFDRTDEPRNGEASTTVTCLV